MHELATEDLESNEHRLRKVRMTRKIRHNTRRTYYRRRAATLSVPRELDLEVSIESGPDQSRPDQGGVNESSDGNKELLIEDASEVVVEDTKL